MVQAGTLPIGAALLIALTGGLMSTVKLFNSEEGKRSLSAILRRDDGKSNDPPDPTIIRVYGKGEKKPGVEPTTITFGGADDDAENEADED